MKRRWYLAVLAVLVAGTMAVNAQLSRDYASEFFDNPTGRALVQAFGALKSGYLTDVDDDKLIRGAMDGMIAALDDPFTSYLPPKDAARENQDLSGSFEGVGAVLTPHDRKSGKGVEILTVYAGGPASKAGVQRGDIFVSVDGVDVSEMSTSEVADLVRGPRGTTVTLVMERPGTDGQLTFNIQRATIQIVSVSSTMLPNDVGYLALSSFNNQQLQEQTIEHLDDLIAQGATSLVLDLRDNSGGLLNQAILIADDFLSEGDIVFQRSRGVTKRLATADPKAYDLPMVVLVNENSASASEIVAGALQDNHRALVVGEQTFGKGVAQSVLSLSDGGQFRYVSFEWLTPDRRSIADRGITPDVNAPDTRYPRTIVADGQGLREGQTAELVVDGKVVGQAVADEDGNFKILTLGEAPEISAVQGEAIVHLDTDTALQTAVATLEDVIAKTKSNADSN
ncbi:MAG: S41 family peptidase [Trueperaceae bacterium]|jgi:carboxyl-terminal processing protease|nr:S41 family peptidase [Truepera sp.]HRQ11320.1 S41 family peptidase [Trueperaceae bacterium]